MKGPRPVTHRYPAGRLASAIAVALAVVVVLAIGAVLAAAPSATPVADAARGGDVDAVRALLQQGTDVNGAHGDGMSALHWAAQRGDRQMAEILVYAGAKVNAVTRIGQYTPLHVASTEGNASLIELLLESGGDVAAATTTSGGPTWRPLPWIASAIARCRCWKGGSTAG
mgnify:CR=1 FL=1